MKHYVLKNYNSDEYAGVIRFIRAADSHHPDASMRFYFTMDKHPVWLQLRLDSADLQAVITFNCSEWGITPKHQWDGQEDYYYICLMGLSDNAAYTKPKVATTVAYKVGADEDMHDLEVSQEEVEIVLEAVEKAISTVVSLENYRSAGFVSGQRVPT